MLFIIFSQKWVYWRCFLSILILPSFGGVCRITVSLMGAQIYPYFGLYLPTSGGPVLLAWASCQASLEVALKEDVMRRRTFLSFNKSMPSCILTRPPLALGITDLPAVLVPRICDSWMAYISFCKSTFLFSPIISSKSSSSSSVGRLTSNSLRLPGALLNTRYYEMVLFPARDIIGRDVPFSLS